MGDAHIPDLLLLRLPSEVMLKEEPFARDVSRVLPILIVVQVLGNFFPNFILNRFSALLSKSDSSHHCSSPSARSPSRPRKRMFNTYLPVPALPLTSYSTFGVRFLIPFLCFCR